MHDRLILLALSPLAVAGSTLSAWLGGHWPQLQAQSELSQSPALEQQSERLHVMRGPDGLLRSMVKINGIPVDMVIDTGATRSILTEEDARRVFQTVEGRSAGEIRTFGGNKELRLKRAATVELGGRIYRQVETGLVQGAPVSVLGLDWLDLGGPISISTGT